MVEPAWISIAVVEAIHARQIAEHGGGDGLRDRGLLESALARPRNRWAYSSKPPELAALAAGYAFGIIKNHPFVDGNKRTAAVVCETFIEMSGHVLTASNEQMYLTFVQLAEGSLSEDELTAWIGGCLAPAAEDSTGG
jgi:death-on-curing protein